MNQKKQYLSAGEVATMLGWSVRLIDGLVKTEKLPGLVIDGQWKFERSELITWLEQKIKTLDRTHIVALENQMDPLSIDGDEHDPITIQLSKTGILLDPPIASKSELLRKLVDFSHDTGVISDRITLLDSLKERESLCSTALPGGWALCHPRRPLGGVVQKPYIRFIRTAEPISFGAEDLSQTQLFFLVVAVDDRGHLQTLARLARILDDQTRAALLTARTPREVYSLIQQREVVIQRKRQAMAAG